MTTDTQLAPTDPEIAALRSEFGITSNGRGIKEFTQVRDFARAVLDKWGQPAHSGEPVAKLVQAAQAFVLDPTSLQKKLYLEAQAWGPLAGTSQPVEREPLTDEQAISLCKMGPVHAPDGQVVRTPGQYRRELEDAKFAGIRKAERAHGIT